MKRKFKKGYWKSVVVGLIGTLVILYSVVSFIRMLLNNKTFLSNFLDYKGAYHFLITANLQYQFTIIVLTIVFFGYLISKFDLYENKYQDASDFGIHGSAKMGNPDDVINGNTMSKDNKYRKGQPIKNMSKLANGIIVGKVPNKNELLIIPPNTDIDNRNVLVIGASGSGKGQAFVLNNIINNTSDTLIVTDPKGELYESTHLIKRDQGYDVFQVDFLNLDGSGYNPLDYVEKDIDAVKIAQAISRNSSKDGKEDFFFNTAKDLLTGLIIYCKSINDKASISLDVKNEFFKISEEPDYLSNVCTEIGVQHPAYQYLKDASVAEGKTRSSILSSFAQQTSIFSLQDVAKMTKKSDFNFHEFQSRKSVLYVKIPMKNNPVEALTATFFDQLISVFYDIADKNHGRLPMDTGFVLDEFANLGKINDYQGTLSTCRGLGMYLCTIVQDFAQLETNYGKEIARTIISNHDTMLFLRTKDVETAKYISNLSGETTAKMNTNSSSKQGTGLFNINGSVSKSTSEQYVKRQLITEGDLLGIKKNACYLFVSGYNPLKLEKSYQFLIYGDLLFKPVKENGKTKYVPNYHSYRNQYLNMLGIKKPKVPVTTDTNDGGNEIEKDNKLEDNFKEQPQLENKANLAKVEKNERHETLHNEQQQNMQKENRFKELATDYLKRQKNILKEEKKQLANNDEAKNLDVLFGEAKQEAILNQRQDELDTLGEIVSSISLSKDKQNESIEKMGVNSEIAQNFDVIFDGITNVEDEVSDDLEIMEN